MNQLRRWWSTRCLQCGHRGRDIRIINGSPYHLSCYDQIKAFIDRKLSEDQ